MEAVILSPVGDDEGDNAVRSCHWTLNREQKADYVMTRMAIHNGIWHPIYPERGVLTYQTLYICLAIVTLLLPHMYEPINQTDPEHPCEAFYINRHVESP